VVKGALPDCGVIKIDPVTDLVAHQAYTAVDDLAASYATLLADLPVAPQLLVAHCQAVTFGLAVAAALGSRGVLPSVVVLDPVWPEAISVPGELALLRATIGAPAATPVTSVSTDPIAALAEIRAVVHADLVESARAKGFDAEVAEMLKEQLGARYLGWMSYVVAATNYSGPLAVPALAVLVDASDLSPADPRHGEIRVVPASRETFLSDPRLATELSRFAVTSMSR
jgi:hypothetical protein